MKNPCWYDDDNNRRKIWMERICSDDKYVDTRRRCKMYSGDRKKNTTLRCLPYFLLIGQPKSGSTSLYSRIMQHPDIISGFLKEPHWWARCRHCRYLQLPYCNSTLLPQSFTEYGDHFSYVAETLHISNKSEKERIVTGEGSQSTLWDHHWWWEYPGNENDKVPRILNAHFIRHILPDVKLLVILRNPVDRLYSDYLFFNKHQQKSVQMFNDKVTHAVHSVNNCLTKNSLRHCAYYKDMSVHVRLQIGLYAVFLKDWMDVFPRKQLLVISLDNFSTNQSVVMSKIFKFLGLRDFGTSETNSEHLNQRSRSNKRIGDMLNETRLMLEKFYKPFNKALSLLMNDTSFLWK
ncbi:carbohydrate sulfotransferase 15-like [Ylistrum balloti]|uniref:carbohydrate sulfotransferase 15-like n=1 Tax=Ylistrum balloti TaxID=509963 RepID=UPI002905D37E|nr:carbohydrate sulfotransferase 15-like [Ylistrum balloti]